MKRIAIIAISALTLLGACNGNTHSARVVKYDGPAVGRIVSRSFLRAHNIGPKGNVTHYNDAWYLVIEDTRCPDTCVSGMYEVSRSTYDAYWPGQIVSFADTHK